MVKSLSDRLDKAEAALDNAAGVSGSKKAADTHATLADAIAGSGQSDVSPSKKPQDVDVIVTGAHGDGKAAVVHGYLRPSARGDGDGSGTLVVEESEAKRVRAQAYQDAASKPAGDVDSQAAEGDQTSSPEVKKSAAAVVGGKVMDSHETMKSAGAAIGGSQAFDAEDQAPKDDEKNHGSKNEDTKGEDAKDEASDASTGSEASKKESSDRKGTSKAYASLSASAVAAEYGSEQESQVGSTGHKAQGDPEEEEQEGGSKGSVEAAMSPHPFVLFGSGADSRQSSLARTLGLAAGASVALAVAATLRP